MIKEQCLHRINQQFIEIIKMEIKRFIRNKMSEKFSELKNGSLNFEQKLTKLPSQPQFHLNPHLQNFSRTVQTLFLNF